MPATRARRWPWLIVALLALLAVTWGIFRVPDLSVAALRAKYGGPPSEYVTVAPGLTVHLRDEGPKDAPVLVLLHGSNASLHTWEPWVARLKDRFRLVSLDLPGHGLTGADPARDYTDAAFGRVVEGVAKARGLDRFVIAGNSMGGGVAWRYALAHPERVRGVVLLDSVGQPDPSGNDLPLAFRIAAWPVVRDIVKALLPRSMIESALQQSVTVQSVMTPAAVDRYWELLRYPGNRDATLDRFATPTPRSDGSDLAKLAVPVLILWGRDDKLIPVSSAAWFAQHLPNSRTVIYDQIGHIPMEETPDASAAEVTKFMAGLPA